MENPCLIMVYGDPESGTDHSQRRSVHALFGIGCLVCMLTFIPLSLVFVGSRSGN